MVLGVIFEDKRQKDFVLLDVVLTYLEYILKVVHIYVELIQYISRPTPVPVLGHTFSLEIHPKSIITGQGKGRKSIKVTWKFFTQISLEITSE